MSNLPITRSHDLNVEHQILLISASTQERQRELRDRMEVLLSKTDWTVLARLLKTRRLLPTLGPRIIANAQNQTCDDFRGHVVASLEATRRQDALLQLISTRAINALADADMSSAEIKGPLLGKTVFGEAGRRISSDIDLLVPESRLNEAVEVVRTLGYASPTDHLDGRLPRLHFTMTHEHGELPPIELHWRVHWYEKLFACNHLLPTRSERRPEWRPALVDEFVGLLLFYARDGFTGLRQAADLSAWWDRFGRELEASALKARVGSYPALQAAISVAAAVAEKTVAMPAGRVLCNLGKVGPRGRIAVLLADPQPYASRQQLYAEIGLIDGLLTPRGGFRDFLRRQVVPPREVIRDHADRAQSAHVTSRAGYASRVLGRYAIALGRLLRIPGTKAPRFSVSKLA